MSEQEANDFADKLSGWADWIDARVRDLVTIGVTASLVEGIAGFLSAAWGPAILAVVLTAAAAGGLIAFLTEMAAELRRLEGFIRQFNQKDGKGVILAAQCMGRMFDCEITIISRDTGNGIVYSILPGPFLKGAWNEIFDVGTLKTIYEPGKVCTINGTSPEGFGRNWKGGLPPPHWKKDNPYRDC